MSTKEKLIERFKNLPSDFTFDELTRLLGLLGYTMNTKGKTSGSRLSFKDHEGNTIMIHRPHPGNIVRAYAMKQILDELINKGKL